MHKIQVVDVVFPDSAKQYQYVYDTERLGDVKKDDILMVTRANEQDEGKVVRGLIQVQVVGISDNRDFIHEMKQVVVNLSEQSRQYVKGDIITKRELLMSDLSDCLSGRPTDEVIKIMAEGHSEREDDYQVNQLLNVLKHI